MTGMLGFSVYLSAPLTAATHRRLDAMAAAGFQGVFTSLHIPEDDATQLQGRLKLLAKWCQTAHLQLIADVDDQWLAKLGWALERPAEILASGVTGLRLDTGFDNQTIAQLTHVMPVALNASTLGTADLRDLKEAGADYSHLEAWHNFYPRPETGLSRRWFSAKNKALQAAGIKVMAFIPGDGVKRGPLHLGLPTLEKHRSEAPLAGLLELQALGCERIYVGDDALSEASLAAIAAYHRAGVITLRVRGLPKLLAGRTWHNRPDVARDVIRLAESRLEHVVPRPIQPALCGVRPVGSLTVDNARYGRYEGEVQLTQVDLPASDAVNVLGRVIAADRALLPFIGASQAIILQPV